MPLILRLDIDKPYGRANLPEKLLSKFSEDLVEIKWPKVGYLDHLPPFFELLGKHNISSYVYFRNCSSPWKALADDLEKAGHVAGFHAENTRSEETFLGELKEFSNKLGKPVKNFSKHGSGHYKLGKNHYPIYEEEKYREWAKKNNLLFPFGNGMVNESSSFERLSFYQDMYWVEPHYRKTETYNLEWLRKNVGSKIIPIITHPENLYAEKSTEKEFLGLLKEFSGDFISPLEFEKNFLLH